MLPIKDQNAFLIVNRASKPDHAGRALRGEFVHLECGIKRVADEYGENRLDCSRNAFSESSTM